MNANSHPIYQRSSASISGKQVADSEAVHERRKWAGDSGVCPRIPSFAASPFRDLPVLSKNLGRIACHLAN